ncbi:hypothetical protein SODALDRAFT_7914 [Sodiomyces alkalinus F11]|uniref:Uncharacterized protein n=1 Tax=Sodiomyces alkalinus (strain CBS 110278 / VKM F-3762 / F11) TaxID=1314773 RepID=A0A3N2Q5R7_SODAK|nr:hypothetical protein SODALDRAFT_7914 [Sodiomyces alkalinus F11]ROT42124.1 hypothetical protein SODALDRAFT_7914 [Sodiomyces alkalinus F11]
MVPRGTPNTSVPPWRQSQGRPQQSDEYGTASDSGGAQQGDAGQSSWFRQRHGGRGRQRQDLASTNIPLDPHPFTGGRAMEDLQELQLRLLRDSYVRSQGFPSGLVPVRGPPLPQWPDHPGLPLPGLMLQPDVFGGYAIPMGQIAVNPLGTVLEQSEAAFRDSPASQGHGGRTNQGRGGGGGRGGGRGRGRGRGQGRGRGRGGGRGRGRGWSRGWRRDGNQDRSWSQAPSTTTMTTMSQGRSMAGTNTPSPLTVFPHRPNSARPPYQSGGGLSSRVNVFGSQLDSDRTTASVREPRGRRGSRVSGTGRQTTMLPHGVQVVISDTTSSDDDSGGGVEIEDPFYLEEFIPNR